MNDIDLLKICEAFGISPVAIQLFNLNADVNRREVKYDFNASAFAKRFVGPFPIHPQPVDTDRKVGEAIRDVVSATNHVAGGGAAGYLAVIDLIMEVFRSDYHHADELVARHVLHRDDDE